MPILLCCFQQSAVVVLTGTAPFGIPATTFWIYISASLLFIIGLIKILSEQPQEHGVNKIMPFGRLFFAIPMAVFGSEHFTSTAIIATLVPSWIPAHTFWVYLVGVGFLCGALSIVVLIQARLAAALIGMTLLIFVIVMDIPAVVAEPRNRFLWALALRELAFSSGAFAFAMSPWSTRPRQSPAQPRTAWIAFPRFCIGLASLFYGVEHLLHPAYVPGIPLAKLSPEWIPGRIFLSYGVGVILLLAGACLLVNKKSRTAATTLGLTILLTVLWIYLPMLLAAPKDVVALNFFFDTLLFCGVILLLANAMGGTFCSTEPPLKANPGLNGPRATTVGNSSCFRRIPLRLHFPSPLLGIFIVHLLHRFRRVRMILHHMFRHSLDHLVPRIS